MPSNAQTTGAHCFFFFCLFVVVVCLFVFVFCCSFFCCKGSYYCFSAGCGREVRENFDCDCFGVQLLLLFLGFLKCFRFLFFFVVFFCFVFFCFFLFFVFFFFLWEEGRDC